MLLVYSQRKWAYEGIIWDFTVCVCVCVCVCGVCVCVCVCVCVEGVRSCNLNRSDDEHTPVKQHRYSTCLGGRHRNAGARLSHTEVL